MPRYRFSSSGAVDGGGENAPRVAGALACGIKARCVEALKISAPRDPDRAGRLVEYHARDAATPGLPEVLEATLKTSWYAPRLQGLAGETQLTVQRVVLDHLLALGASSTASAQVKAIAKSQAIALKNWINEQLGHSGDSPEVKAHWASAVTEISQFERDPDRFKPPEKVLMPPGAPIGGGE